MDQINAETHDEADATGIRKQTSMGSLIMWNITRATEANPSIDLKSAIKTTQERLESDAGNALVAQSPEEEYIACALLAWQQLGHSGPDTLYQFVETKRKEISDRKLWSEKTGSVKRQKICPGSFISYDSMLSKGVELGSYDSYSLVGPVVKLPVDTKIVMRLDNAPANPAPKRKQGQGFEKQNRGRENLLNPDKDLKNKIDAACCMESACIDKLNDLDKATTELRLRAERLARREAERVELLERAEAAWKDLELGYQRRLALAEEKEDDMTKHIKKLIDERNGYKNACTNLAQQLRKRGEVAEKERAKLNEVKQELCENACMRLRLSEESAKLDATLSEQQCKGAQMDRDFQFKEEQIRRKLQTLEGELESAQALTYEVERALHAELNALKAQVTKVSQQLLEEDAVIGQIKEELDLLRQEKLKMVENLDGCKEVCDGRIQAQINDLKKKKEQLEELKERVIECQCKMPVDASVEVKRTPSLAALCKCTPEDKFLSSCSCTSLRTTLLTSLLEDLFGGLQSEMPGCKTEMPCQLLKCLEDRHNWDKSSIVKTNLRNFFSQLLIGELDIAIATSIEKYHARWVGASCADAARIIPDRGGPETEGWQERALERRAQKLACKLAEQLYQERAEELTAKAKEIVNTGPPPCECKPRPGSAAVFPCLVKHPPISSATPTAPIATSGAATPAYWRRTQKDVVQLRVQLEDLKKDSIKKEDLKIMEENIIKLVQQATETENIVTEAVKDKQKKEVDRKGVSIQRPTNTEQAIKHSTNDKLSSIKKKLFESTPQKNNKNLVLGVQNTEKPAKSLKKIGQSYAVNLCLCSSEKDKKNKNQDLISSPALESRKRLRGVATRSIAPQVSSMKQSKILDSQLSSIPVDIGQRGKNLAHSPCPSNQLCFHKPPSTTSLNKLFETLAKWKCDLSNIDCKCITRDKKTRDASPNTDNVEGEYREIIPDVMKRRKPEKKVFKNVSTKFSINKSSTPFKSRIIMANVPQSTEYPTEMPANTESIYMGAINLDKSNENICKCVANVQKEQDANQEPTTKIIQCINSAACFCRNPEIRKSLNNNVLKSEIVTDCNKDILLGNVQKDENSIQTDNKLESDINHVVKTPTLFPSDCEYCIKFLGVALSNVTSDQVLTKKDKDPKHENYVSNKGTKQRNNHREVWYDNVDMSAGNKPRTQLPAYGRNVKHGEKKDILTGPINKQQGDYCKNEDKSFNTPNFKNITDKESCICCRTDKLDESKDLEMNAFHLLEEHLRDKLEEFKLTNCKSYCIPLEEEERIFSTILEKVKKIIIDNTSVIACKCDPEEPVEGSWHRAYMLLQEYLKIKIKRVQCLCLSTNNDEEAVLPNVMEKVCNLIDNDFQRLKEICKCQNKSEGQVPNVNNELPEKDICETQDDETNTSNKFKIPEKMSKEISNRSLIVTQNISSQIAPNIETETTSCDIIEMTNTVVDTGHTGECCRITKLNYDHCYCTNTTKNTKSYVEMFGAKEVFINQCINVVKEEKEVSYPTNMETVQGQNLSAQNKTNRSHSPDLVKNTDQRKSSPYIGYTVDCSCDSALGTCVCTKSMVSSNKDNMNSIWNTLTSNKLRHIDTSYIMDAVPNKGLTDSYDLKKTRKTIEPQACNTVTCGTASSAQDCDDLVLKYSNTKNNKTFLSTNTSGEDVRLSPDFNQNLNNFTDNNTCDDALHYSSRNFMNRGTNNALGKSDPIESLSSSCDCNMVPICHVKMLVENIENKLIHSRCTCDSLSSKICPVHSKTL